MWISLIYIRQFHEDQLNYYHQTISVRWLSFTSNNFIENIFIYVKLFHRGHTILYQTIPWGSNHFIEIIFIYIKPFYRDHLHLHQTISWGSSAVTLSNFIRMIIIYKGWSESSRKSAIKSHCFYRFQWKFIDLIYHS